MTAREMEVRIMQLEQQVRDLTRQIGNTPANFSVHGPAWAAFVGTADGEIARGGHGFVNPGHIPVKDGVDGAGSGAEIIAEGFHVIDGGGVVVLRGPRHHFVIPLCGSVAQD